MATAGVSSSGGTALAAIEKAAGGEISARPIVYDGGNPAAIATAAGEAMATTQLASEQAELIKAGRLRPLAAMSSEPLEIEGIEPIPPITQFMEIDVAPDYFGILIPVGAPQEVYDAVDQAWEEAVMEAQEIKDYALQRGATFDPAYGQEAKEKARPVIAAEACARVERGEADGDPAAIGVDCDAL